METFNARVVGVQPDLLVLYHPETGEHVNERIISRMVGNVEWQRHVSGMVAPVLDADLPAVGTTRHFFKVCNVSGPHRFYVQPLVSYHMLESLMKKVSEIFYSFEIALCFVSFGFSRNCRSRR